MRTRLEHSCHYSTGRGPQEQQEQFTASSTGRLPEYRFVERFFPADDRGIDRMLEFIQRRHDMYRRLIEARKSKAPESEASVMKVA